VPVPSLDKRRRETLFVFFKTPQIDQITFLFWGKIFSKLTYIIFIGTVPCGYHAAKFIGKIEGEMRNSL